MSHGLTYRIDGLDDAFISPPEHLFRFQVTRTGVIGEINAFPLELFHEVLGLLDLQSVADFRIVCTKAMWIVDSLPQHKLLITHIPGVLWALLATGVASHITISDLYDIFCTPRCYICDEFGPFLFLPDFKRCCMCCLTTALEFMPMLVSQAKRIFRLRTAEIVDCVPIVHTVPGRYTMKKTEHGRRLRLVSFYRAEGVLDETPDFNSELERWARKLCPKISRKAGHIGLGHIHRFMCAIPFPYFDPTLRTVDCGVLCKGCKRSGEPTRDYVSQASLTEEMFTERGFWEHLKECSYAQELLEEQGGLEASGSHSN